MVAGCTVVDWWCVLRPLAPPRGPTAGKAGREQQGRSRRTSRMQATGGTIKKSLLAAPSPLRTLVQNEDLPTTTNPQQQKRGDIICNSRWLRWASLDVAAKKKLLIWYFVLVGSPVVGGAAGDGVLAMMMHHHHAIAWAPGRCRKNEFWRIISIELACHARGLCLCLVVIFSNC